MTEQKSIKLNLQGKRATILGLAREGRALARFLVQQGAQVTVSDQKTAEALRDTLAELSDLPLRYVLGGHPPEILDTDVLFVSPGMPLDAPIMLAARRRGLTQSNESRLFARLCPAPIVGITGSSGKTTTSTLVSLMLQANGKHAYLGGNIGRPLIGELAQVHPADVVVMELSSFQLEFFGPELDAELAAQAAPSGGLGSAPLFPAGGWSPPFAAVLNVTPNHLDRHSSMEAYVAAKAKIMRYQRVQDHAVLNWDDPVSHALADQCVGQVSYLSLREAVPRGACLHGHWLVLRQDGRETRICSSDELLLRGQHNLANVLAACALCALLGVSTEQMASVARSFGGVEHRLELVDEWHGVRYYNDSIATSPERAMAALHSFDEPIVLLAGGRDKHLPWEDWAHLVCQKVTHVITFGEVADLIENALAKAGSEAPPIHHAEDLEGAVRLARTMAVSGQVVLFSPGGTSFDAFRDYEERGLAFKRLVRSLDHE
jgi:UDP-N-acetylmuramoylalanine--D-glutamate ligase